MVNYAKRFLLKQVISDLALAAAARFTTFGYTRSAGLIPCGEKTAGKAHS
jgi:hypothetical protein